MLVIFRNGRPLGVAVSNLEVGPGIVYFPAVSLAHGEKLTTNFGAAPFRYPQNGFEPLECPSIADLYCAKKCFEWLLRIINLSVHWTVIYILFLSIYSIFAVKLKIFSFCNEKEGIFSQ